MKFAHIWIQWQSLQALLIVVTLWEAVAFSMGSGLFPHTWEVLQALAELICESGFYNDLATSLGRALAGYLLGAMAGISLGVVGVAWPGLGKVAGTLVVWVRPLPPIALAPFFVLLMGLGESSKVTLVAYGVFFPVWITTTAGLANVNRKLIWSAQSFGASRRDIAIFVLLPASLVPILAGLRTAIGMALTCLVGAEVSGAVSGLMYRIELSRVSYAISQVIAGLVVLAIVGAAADRLFLAFAGRVSPGAFKMGQQGDGGI